MSGSSEVRNEMHILPLWAVAQTRAYHYRAGPRVMEDGDLVLVDAGSEKSFYASDVTRTWPVSGAFSEAQKEIYALVLDAQKQYASKRAEPGRPSMEYMRSPCEYWSMV